MANRQYQSVFGVMSEDQTSFVRTFQTTTAIVRVDAGAAVSLSPAQAAVLLEGRGLSLGFTINMPDEL